MGISGGHDGKFGRHDGVPATDKMVVLVLIFQFSGAISLKLYNLYDRSWFLPGEQREIRLRLLPALVEEKNVNLGIPYVVKETERKNKCQIEFQKNSAVNWPAL
jgi:hypothetical protein